MRWTVFIAACVCACSHAPTGRRALYVSDVAPVLHDDADLLGYARRAGIDRLALYGLERTLDDPAAAAELARFLARARAAGIRWIAAPVAEARNVDAIEAFVRAHPGAWFDALVTEREYWHEPGERAAAFAAFAAVLARMRAFADVERARGRRVEVGAYLGYPTRDEVAAIAAAVDFVWLNYSVPEPRGDWRAERLRWLRDAGVPTWPIFYSRGDTHMAAWLAEHGLVAAERAFLRTTGRAGIAGFVYFAYPSIAAVRH